MTDFTELKKKQRAPWALGEYDRIADGLTISTDQTLRERGAEALPFADAGFDVVVSTCGHMFAPNQTRVAAKLARVTRPGGRVVFLAWTPEGGLGGWFRITNKHFQPSAGPTFPW